MGVAKKSFIGLLYRIGGFFYSIFAFVIAGLVTEDMASGMAVTIIFIVLVSPGMVCIIIGIAIKERVKKFKNYVSYLSGDGAYPINILANVTDSSVHIVQSDLKKMIEQKYFSNAYLDENTGELIIGERKINDGSQQDPQPRSTPETEEIESFKCPACSAVGKKPKGKSRTCEYCGTVVA